MNIWIAAADNNLEKVKEYLKQENLTANSRDENGYTPVHAAAEYSHLDLLKFLVESGGDVNIKDNDGDTPLHACESVKAAELLINLGAKLDIKNDDDLTPLQKAEEDADFPELIKYLRKASGIEADDEFPDDVKLSVRPENTEDLPSVQISDEQRERLAEIIQSGESADFEEYVKNVLTPSAQNESSKKSRTE